MIEVKRTTKWDGKLKGLHFEGDILIDENGEIVNLNAEEFCEDRK